ncbi:MAG: arginine deiminase family protein [Acidobacteriota bacterium]|nr:arginine deiminase family protein [Acidobacteriota bacterium]
MHRAIVRKPAPNFSEGLTTASLGAPDYEQALSQHQFYCEALERCGLLVTNLEPDHAYPDSTFVEDTAVVVGEVVVLTRPRAASRTDEVAIVAETLKQFFSRVETIQDPGRLDGGDVCEAGSHYFIGISERTNETGARQLGQFLKTLGHTCSFIDIRGIDGLLHLKSGVAFLGDNRFVVIDSLARLKEFSDYQLVRVAEGEEYAANCLRINEHVLIAEGYSRLAETLASLGYQTIALNMSEFQKMDGGLSCLSLRF